MKKKLDLIGFKQRLEGSSGREYWRSIDELARDPELGEFLHREFPRQAAALDGVDRRDFLKLMSASMAMAGLTACRRPVETIIPYVNAPEQFVPGKPTFFATTMIHDGVGTGLLVESHMGRPTKVEGNPLHPGSLGATDLFAQAAILSLYDPDRSQTVLQVGEVSTWAGFLAAWIRESQRLAPNAGRGLHILSGAITSPTLGAQMAEVLTRFPAAQWHQYEPAGYDNTREGTRQALGNYSNAIYHLDQADVVLSLDADFLAYGRGHVRYARDFMDRRRIRSGSTVMNRLYVLESMPTSTGAVSDHQFSLKPSDIAAAAAQIAAAVGAGGTTAGGATFANAAAIAEDLISHRSRSVVIAGENQPPEVHALAHRLNRALGNVGTTVTYGPPLEVQPVNGVESLRQLVAAMNAGAVETLVMIGGNPAFDAPADFQFIKALEKVRLRVHLSPYYDETSVRCEWHVPQTHFLEEWSDARAFDGTVSLVQPLIAPLYNGRSAHELLGAMAENAASPYDMLRTRLQSSSSGDFGMFWRKALHDGVVPGEIAAPRSTAVTSSGRGEQANRGGGETSANPLFSSSPVPLIASPPAGLEIIFREDPTIHDGRFANNGWLQELPKPITKITWDNVALMAPSTAQRLGVSDGQVVVLQRKGGGVRVPVWRVPGHAEDCVTVHFGYGRERAGRVGNEVGRNVYGIRTSDAMRSAGDLQIEKTGELVRIATTQEHHQMEGRDPVRELTLAQFIQDPEVIRKAVPEMKGPSLYEPYKYEGYAWGMQIDTNACIGCGICTIACQSENNIPIVGKEQVLMGREMHWIRVDHYFKGSPENPTSHVSQPIPCMHCENAPCEPVCPVEATSHSDEGLNDMTYNRCVGTRYCANNCPYKVRRFNFFEFTEWDEPSLALMRNPDVTVRSRGVMEKCTYCVQRINASRIEAETQGRKIRDGEFTTACAQACPTQAIVFGNINDPEAAISKLKKEPTDYGLLTELNTQPRTTYRPTFRNPNPAVKKA